jgi:hypothetical protein
MVNETLAQTLMKLQESSSLGINAPLENSADTISTTSENGDLYVLYGGAYSIHGYYMESGNPRQMRGASELLLQCMKEVCAAFHLVGQGEAGNDLWYITGSLLFAYLSGSGSDFAHTAVKIAEEIFKRNCQTANAAFACFPVTLPDAVDFDAQLAYGMKRFQERRYMKFIPIADAEAMDTEGISRLTGKDFYEISELDKNSMTNKNPERCNRCRLRQAQYQFRNKFNSEILHLCTSCSKRIAKGCDKKSEFRSNCKTYFNETIGIKYSLEMQINNSIATTSDLSDRDGRVALIMADINNLSLYGKKISGFEEHRLFSQAIKNITHTAVNEALSRAMLVHYGKKLHDSGSNMSTATKESVPSKSEIITQADIIPSKFEIIAVGGDDIVLLVPGDVALMTSCLLAQTLDTEWQKEQEKAKQSAHYSASNSEYEKQIRNLPITISVAAVVAADSTAISYMEDVGERKLKEAKRYAREHTQSAVNITFLGGEEQWKLDAQEGRQSIFPLTVKQANAFEKTLKAADQIAITKLRNIVDAYRELHKEEGYLWFNYQRVKEREPAEDAFEKLMANLAENDFNTDTVWNDLVLWRNQKNRR